MLDLNELIQSGSDTSKISNSQNNSATLFEYLPQFLWVIRDFTLKFPEGITTARDYMLQALTTELDSSTPKKVSLRMRKELAEVDEIRRTIVSSFNNIDCHTMPLPISNPEAVGFPDVPSAMQALDTIPYEKLSKNFLQTMEEFNSKAFSMLSLKRLKDGTLMNGTSFSHLVKIYANQINSSGIVRISEAYQYMVKEVAQKTMEQAITKYRKYMQYLLRHPDNKSASDSFLNHCNLVSFNKSIEILRRDLLGTTNQIENAIKNFKKNIIHLNHEQQLDKNCVFAEFSLQNSQLIAKENEELIKTLWRDTVELRLTGEGAEFASQYDYSEATQKFARDYFMSCIPGKQANELYIQYCDKIQQNGQRMQWIFRQKEMLANQVLQSEAETNRIKQSSAEAIQEAERLFNDIEGIQNKHHKFQNELEEKLRLKERELSRLRDRLWH
ncbi:hypothetical protein K7432_010563 [Basidiobolus ranarum]|uniref:Guanylate-binding protein N-terminal domain-containing protein n=1 Tax=Basidiobolus ranarum TaxID=34480 RepID=A0ABR2WNM1_9FUNG